MKRDMMCRYGLSAVLLLALGWASPVFAGADEQAEALPERGAMFRHVDADGRVYFSDQPGEGGERVELPQGNRFEGRQASERARSASEQRSRRDLERPQQVDESVAREQEAARDEAALLEQRIRECEQSNIADCSRETVKRRLEEERYRQTPEGRRQQQAVGNRANP
ncbi:DUF4124 domain-containing protein [Isoalcanivorax indicus]|uniref:DUF4124 domain-containing protein n=1 Tax=Isoalcanivorax indicus TaxID=2202653 RepID=UPI000DB971AD|nr:DUF4124 domain-containing protein [Isoalcanivorax indicus]